VIVDSREECLALYVVCDVCGLIDQMVFGMLDGHSAKDLIQVEVTGFSDAVQKASFGVNACLTHGGVLRRFLWNIAVGQGFCDPESGGAWVCHVAIAFLYFFLGNVNLQGADWRPLSHLRESGR
jgi:hypothetical protein